ncbi:MAG: hypothetical protein M3R50_08575 [Bacteroidota bacterium]|nr:hypothetical protein [Bacteroidota bacterium]
MNCNRNIFYLVFVLLFFIHTSSFAQVNEAEPDSVLITTTQDSAVQDYEDIGDTVITKVFFKNNDSVSIWKKSHEFAYMAYLDSMLRRKKNDLKSDTFSFNNNHSARRKKINISDSDIPNSFLNSFAIRIFFWIIATAFILFILYKLFFTGELFSRDQRTNKGEPLAEEPEQLNEYSEYNELIRNAESNKDYNLAVRYLYLQTLKKLSDNEIILFSPDKTNNKYVEELSGQSYQKEFASLTHNYEYVWYGKFSIVLNRYEQLKEQFISFNKTI